MNSYHSLAVLTGLGDDMSACPLSGVESKRTWTLTDIDRHCTYDELKDLDLPCHFSVPRQPRHINVRQCPLRLSQYGHINWWTLTDIDGHWQTWHAPTGLIAYEGCRITSRARAGCVGVAGGCNAMQDREDGNYLVICWQIVLSNFVDAGAKTIKHTIIQFCPTIPENVWKYPKYLKMSEISENVRNIWKFPKSKMS